MSDAKRIKELLRDRVAELAPYLFPNGKRDGNHWCVGDITGTPGKSFKICIAGEKAGLWGDFADSGEHSRSLLDLWMAARNVDFKTALHDAAQWLGQRLHEPNADTNGAATTYPRTQAAGTIPRSAARDMRPTTNLLDEAIAARERLLKMRATRRDFYPDRNGNEHFVVVRFDSDTEKQFRPFCRNGSGWIGKDPPGKLPLFRLPELIARPDERVFVVEGEKCACELATLGLLVTTSAHGAKSAHKSDWQLLGGREVVILPDNDPEGHAYASTIAGILTRSSPPAEVRIVDLPGLPPKGDCVDWLDARDAQTPEGIRAELLDLLKNAEVIPGPDKPRPLIEFKTPLQLKNFVPPAGMILVGDCHIVRGSVFVIGGAPGIGKSRSSVALGQAGAIRSDWFGLTVHRAFKTMIIQTENGLFRLSKEFSELDCKALEDYVRICPPPPFGLCLGREDFRAQLSAAIREFGPNVIILDPWNAAARDEKAREYLETFELIRSVVASGDDAPAIGIVAHTRKPRADERATGRGLLNLLSGSYVLGSVPRTVFVMQAASDDTTDNRIVWTCCKNNDGELGPRSAWERRNGLFAPVLDFDWDAFDNPHTDDRVTITADDMAEIFENGAKQRNKTDAAKALQTLTGAGRTACYSALKSNGRFAKHLRENDGLLSWIP
jgi:hypothetical protein